MRVRAVVAILLASGVSAHAHRLDEYLQGAIVSIAKDKVQIQMTLTPGVAVLPAVLSSIDTDGNGAVSVDEQRAYAGRVLQDLSLKIDGHPVTSELVSVRFPAQEEMKEGRGEIVIDFKADLPGGGRNRKLTLENRHQSAISAYQVNSLVPRDPNIRIEAQVRNYSQSAYELDYTETDVRSTSPAGLWPASGALLLLLGVAAMGLSRGRKERARLLS